MKDVAKIAVQWWIDQLSIRNNILKDDSTNAISVSYHRRFDEEYPDNYSYLNWKVGNIAEKDLKLFEKLLIQEITLKIEQHKNMILGAAINAYGILKDVAEQSNIDINVFPIYTAMVIFDGKIEVSEGFYKPFKLIA